MVSIIIPVYNGERYIASCIESVLLQNNNNYELIIIDDGSKDSTLEIIKRYEIAHGNIRVVTQKNQGVSVARQTGISCATGEWILFLDADDLLKENAVDIVEKHKKCDIIIFSKKLQIENNGEWHGSISQLYLEVLGQQKSKPFCGVNLSTVWSKAYNRTLIVDNNINFIRNLSNGEDMLFNIECISKCKSIFLCKESIYLFRKNQYSVSYRYSSKSVSSDYLFLTNLKRVLPNEYSSAEDSIYYKVALNGLWTCIRQEIAHPENNETYSECKKCLIKLLNTEPYKTAVRNLDRLCVDKRKKIVFRLTKIGFYKVALLIASLSRKTNSGSEEIMEI